MNPRLHDQARRFAVEHRAYVRAVQLLLTDWTVSAREGIDRAETLEVARRYLERAARVHALEHTARQLAAMGEPFLSSVDTGRGLGLLGDYCEERSAGFVAGLAGMPDTAPHQPGARAQAWLEGHAAGDELKRRGLGPELPTWSEPVVSADGSKTFTAPGVVCVEHPSDERGTPSWTITTDAKSPVETTPLRQFDDRDVRNMRELGHTVEPVVQGIELLPCGLPKSSIPAPKGGYMRLVYPPDWPRCQNCGDPVLDGHVTCGDVRCDEAGHR